MGGRFATGSSPIHDFFPGSGGVAGLVKTLAREWPSIRCRVVDFSPEAPVENIAAQLLDEIFVSDGYPEIGYEGDRRIRLRSVISPLSFGQPGLELYPGEPVLISGGARGITALVAAELARTWRPTLLMLGTTPLPSGSESADTAGLTGEAEIKSALHARLRHQGQSPSPAQIESSYQSLVRAREVRENLEILRAAGATVAYAQADVRDPAALARVLDQWRARYGEPAGLIHGAGLIKDKLIRQKTIESFDRVLETKLYGALNLIRLTAPGLAQIHRSLFVDRRPLRQRRPVRLRSRQRDPQQARLTGSIVAWPGRVLSVIWGPWSGVGMVSQLESHLGRRGLGMISPVGWPLAARSMSCAMDAKAMSRSSSPASSVPSKIRSRCEAAAEPLEIGS